MTAATTFTNSLPSPAYSINDKSPLPEGKLSPDLRAQIESELEQIRKSMAELQAAYNAAHATIPQFQQLVLSTHAKVAELKQAVLQAKGISSSTNSSASNSSPPSNASSPPSPSSPLNHMQDAEHEERLRKLEQLHLDLGNKLTQSLREKAEAEENKKRISDNLMRTRHRIKELEQRLHE
ncbi:hypothetical protein B0O80DRAFT_502800 [Mortierella sp. GBAus27b]|nr:hypothetical protein BGX31_001840 [Mortierella sp. GBA43]KAI8347232.1 hypothetical protein B0O80DRAFT_502800 [Mortierella sp. GBAus27b]